MWLGGVKIAHTHKLKGHSDADVALHALTDALLGAAGGHFIMDVGGFGGTTGGILAFLGAVLAGAGWSIFHILVITLQAFIFMILTVVYLSMSTEAH